MVTQIFRAEHGVFRASGPQTYVGSLQETDETLNPQPPWPLTLKRGDIWALTLVWAG